MGTIADLLNTAMRDFQRYTGDGLPNEPAGRPLPVGDPASGQFNPPKKLVRDAFIAIAETADDLTDAAEGAAADRLQTGLDRVATQADSAAALSYNNQAQIAAIAAGAPLVTVLTDPVPANGSVELLQTEAGTQVHEVQTGVWVQIGWLGVPVFPTISAMAAAPGFIDGQFVDVEAGFNGEKERFKRDASSTQPANGALIVDAVGMGADPATRGRFESQRTVYADLNEFETDPRPNGFFATGTILHTLSDGYTLEVAPTGSVDPNYASDGGVRVYAVQPFISSPRGGRPTVALDVKHFSQQGAPSAPQAIAVHDYAPSLRTLQIDKTDGSQVGGSYILGLRQASNEINTPDTPGTNVSTAGFMLCSRDKYSVTAIFTGSISGSILTVTAKSAGILAAGKLLTWAGVDNGTKIASQLSGTTGGVGTYSLTVRGETVNQTVASQAMDGWTKTGVLAYKINNDASVSLDVDPAKTTTGYFGASYPFEFVAGNQASGPVASFASSSGPVLTVSDNAPVGGLGTRTDLETPAAQTSGFRLATGAGGIDLAPFNNTFTMRGNINSQSGSDMTVTAVGAKLQLNGSTGVRSIAPFELPPYTVATAPSAAAFAGHEIRVLNGSAGGLCLAVSNGTNWLVSALGAPISAT